MSSEGGLAQRLFDAENAREKALRTVTPPLQHPTLIGVQCGANEQVAPLGQGVLAAVNPRM